VFKGVNTDEKKKQTNCDQGNDIRMDIAWLGTQKEDWKVT
jgi:hypothetical protein